MKTKTIVITEPAFYCHQDEKCFFKWLEGLKAWKSTKHTPKGLCIEFSLPIDDDSLADLIGLLTRYRVSRTSLRGFLTPENQEWFARSRSYWYRAVFRNE
jgi:hypothetical protein